MMKRLSVPLLAVVCLAVIACLTCQAGASDWANPNPSSYYGYGAAGNGYGMAGYSPANFAPDVGYGGPSMASYPQYGYAAYNYPAYGGYGNGSGGCGCGSGGCGGGRGWGHHRHCCSFGGNSICCGDAWNGYGAGGGGCGAGGCGAGGCGVKVFRRHRPLGCGAGPCVDGSCTSLAAGYATNCGKRHFCHLRRNRAAAYWGACGCSDCGGGAVMDGTQVQGGMTPMQPGMSGPTPVESLPPSLNNEAPSPGDDSST